MKRYYLFNYEIMYWIRKMNNTDKRYPILYSPMMFKDKMNTVNMFVNYCTIYTIRPYRVTDIHR